MTGDEFEARRDELRVKREAAREKYEAAWAEYEAAMTECMDFEVAHLHQSIQPASTPESGDTE
ncbi:hypothetical protein [Nocardia asiatica]|uniref:hypothetical protein n=1 Tax=Nocardia asiatica TaxID=209252 RepID=UPI002456BC16|nr:hypothetical protein [Nocardia asiatica]